jgi:hypothetical protein
MKYPYIPINMSFGNPSDIWGRTFSTPEKSTYPGLFLTMYPSEITTYLGANIFTNYFIHGYPELFLRNHL